MGENMQVNGKLGKNTGEVLKKYKGKTRKLDIGWRESIWGRKNMRN
jgi:hypothetical protein